MAHEKKTIARREDDGARSVVSSWKILVVDDDPDVHKVTRLVLHGFTFQDRQLDLIHCYSGDEARRCLSENHDIALVMLDVVLEERDTGFRLVEYIRKELNNRIVRIILRTGHQGEAPETSTVISYDINDYKSKTELTSEKMIASVAACLRSYGDMKTIARHREGLERIVIGSDRIFHTHTFGGFLHEVLVQYGIIATGNAESSLKAIAISFRSGEMIVSAQTGYGAEVLSKKAADIIDDEGQSLLKMSRDGRIDVYQGGKFAAYFASSGGEENMLYMEIGIQLDDWQHDLLEIFGANVLTAFENQYLRVGLERTVVHRTTELVGAKEELERTLGEMKIINEKLLLANGALESSRAASELDMRMAVNVQQNILPKSPPVSDRWDISFHFRPMSGVSGDFYDFYTDEEGRISGFSLFDVSGHGIASGLITMLSKTVVFRRFRGMTDKPLGSVIDSINDDLIAELGNLPHFLSGVVFRISENLVEYANAGHPDIIMMRKDGVSCVEIHGKSEKGFYLGLDMMRKSYDSIVLDMSENDTIVAFSDGLFESSNRSGIQYGLERLKSIVLKTGWGSDSAGILNAIVSDFESYTGDNNLEDDITLIVARRLQ